LFELDIYLEFGYWNLELTHMILNPDIALISLTLVLLVVDIQLREMLLVNIILVAVAVLALRELATVTRLCDMQKTSRMILI
jgi:hypothetical protein